MIYVPGVARTLAPDIRDALLCADEDMTFAGRADFIRLALERCEIVAKALRKALEAENTDA